MGSHNEDIHFEATDYFGRHVFCSEERWVNHILRRRNIDVNDVIRALESPILPVYRDKDYSNRIVYYAKNKRGVRYTKVVVEYPSKKLGEVITTFYTDSMRPGDLPLFQGLE